MAPTDKMIEEARNRLTNIQLTLTAETTDPTKPIRPLDPVTLKWEATVPSGPMIEFKLNGVKIPSSGTRIVRPVRTTSYVITAKSLTVLAMMGEVTVDVDLSDCYVITMPEHELASAFEASLASEYPEEQGKNFQIDFVPDLRVRAKQDRIRLTVDTGGIKVSGEMDVEIDKMPDGTLKFDALVALGAEDNKLVYKILSFNPTFSFKSSGWLDVFSLGSWTLAEMAVLMEIGEKILTHVANVKLREDIDAGINETLKMWDIMFQSTGHALLVVTAAEERVDATLCKPTPT